MLIYVIGLGNLEEIIILLNESKAKRKVIANLKTEYEQLRKNA